MFRFENTTYFYLLFALIPLILLVVQFYRIRLRDYKKLAETGMLKQLLPGLNIRSSLFKNLIFVLIMVFSIIALANPQWSDRRESVTAGSSDVLIAMDISRSMLAQDISPDRLARTKRIIEDLILELRGNRIGLIFYAGEAFLKMPLSNDHAAAILFVKSAHPDIIENQGTATEEAIKIAENVLDKEGDHQKALIIFSDGEDHDGNPVQAARRAAEKGVISFTVGIGTEKGGFVPDKNRFGAEVYKKDLEGKPVRTRMDPAALSEIALAGNGYYFDISDKDLVSNIAERMERIEKRELVQRSFVDFRGYFPYFLSVSMILLIIFIIFPDRKIKINI